VRHEHIFIAERALAQHSPELLRAAPGPDELLPLLALAGEKLAKAVSPLLAPLLGGEAPAIRADAPQECEASTLAEQIAPLAANCLLVAGNKQAPLLVSLQAEAVLRLVDRAYGGKGDVAAVLPEEFPLSAELMIARLEALVIAALGQAFGLAWPGAIRPLRREGSLTALAPFAPDTRLTRQCLTITEPGAPSWTLTLAMPSSTLAELCGPGAKTPPANLADRVQPNPSDAPYGALPLTLSAVLVDMAMPVSLLSALEIGQVLPVSIARSVPLRIGAATIAHGTIGTLDERVAVQITNAF
jgi:flagellar motor switch protein FliM